MRALFAIAANALQSSGITLEMGWRAVCLVIAAMASHAQSTYVLRKNRRNHWCSGSTLQSVLALWTVWSCGTVMAESPRHNRQRPPVVQSPSTNDVCLSEPKCVELFQSANNLLKAELYPAALALFETAYAQYPAAWLLVSIGRTQQKLERLPAAINSYRQFLASIETTTDPLLTQKVQEYLQQAQSSVVDVCLANPKCTELNETARNLSKIGQVEAALTLYQTAYSQFPAPWLLVNIGRAQQKLNRLPAAIESLRQYLASADAKEDPELTKKAQEYLYQAEADYEPPPAPFKPPPPPPPPPPPLCTPEQEEQELRAGKPLERQARNGLVVGLGIATRQPILQVDGNTSITGSSVGASLLLGVKLNRVILSLWGELDAMGSTVQLGSAAGSSISSVSTSSFLIGPALQLSVLRAAAGRFELLGSAQLGMGRSSTAHSADPLLPSTVATDFPSTTFQLGYQVGPGLRFYVLRQAAISFIGGVAGDHLFVKKDSPSGLRADQLYSISLFGTLGALGVF